MQEAAQSMLNMIPLDERTLIAGQIQPGDVQQIAKAGVRLVVNNRPDGEAVMGQPRAAMVEEAAHAEGLAFLDLPFTMHTLTPEHVARFAEALKTSEGRVLAYCRSGSRSSLLWAASRVAAGADVDAVLAQAQDAGIDLAQARGLIDQLGRLAANSL
jgi:sulfide:quinone oxidoreductase